MSNTNDKVIRSIQGHVIGRNEDCVEVEFTEQEVSVLFPRRLFASEDDTFYGSTILYQICERSDGTRYDRCVRTKPDGPNPYLDEVMAKFDEILKK